MIDIAPYFDRIQYNGTLSPTLDTLQALHARHARALPFENLSPLTGAEVPLDIPSLLRKFTVDGRGGYCYEHNRLFQYVLEQLGFKTIGLAARVRLNVPDDVVTARTHMLLLVECENRQWLADTGFGGMTLTAPLRFVPGEVQDTPHGKYRLLEERGTYFLQAHVKDDWPTLYAFDLTPQFQVDYEVSNWYVARHPASHFVRSLIVARAAEEGRHTLRDGLYSFYPRGAEAQKRQVHTVRELKELLGSVFHIRTDGIPGLEQSLEAVLASAARE